MSFPFRKLKQTDDDLLSSSSTTTNGGEESIQHQTGNGEAFLRENAVLHTNVPAAPKFRLIRDPVTQRFRFVRDIEEEVPATATTTETETVENTAAVEESTDAASTVVEENPVETVEEVAITTTETTEAAEAAEAAEATDATDATAVADVVVTEDHQTEEEVTVTPIPHEETFVEVPVQLPDENKHHNNQHQTVAEPLVAVVKDHPVVDASFFRDQEDLLDAVGEAVLEYSNTAGGVATMNAQILDAVGEAVLEYSGFSNYRGNILPRSIQVDGAQGPTGPQGPEGPTGFDGAQGFQGFQGVMGYDGPQGYQGYEGPEGPTGPDGPFGPAGPTGPQGHQGSAGATGDRGATGDAGYDGQQGFQGPQGYTGFDGAQGYQGPTGEPGYDGSQGPTGFQGYQGSKGKTGSQGEEGPTGHQGPEGPQGYTGFDGAQGFQGYQGPEGPTGLDGPDGPTGYTGTEGAQGYQGYQGPVGYQGYAGNADFTLRYQGLLDASTNTAAGYYLIKNDSTLYYLGAAMPSTLTTTQMSNGTSYVLENDVQYEIYQVYASSFSNATTSNSLTVLPIILTMSGGTTISLTKGTVTSVITSVSSYTLGTGSDILTYNVTGGVRVGAMVYVPSVLPSTDRVFVSTGFDLQDVSTASANDVAPTPLSMIQNVLDNANTEINVDDLLDIIKNL